MREPAPRPGGTITAPFPILASSEGVACNASMQGNEIEHSYGPDVHILGDPYLLTLLARLGHPETSQRELRPLLARIYERLLGAALASEFPTETRRVPTRMREFTEHGYFEGDLLVQDKRVVIACLVRAGGLPSEICYDSLVHVLAPEHIRLDYLSMSRRVDEAGRVVGTDDSGCKIGGRVEDSILVIPDPMGATGGTIQRTLEIYKERDLGTPSRILVLPMISTPEFMRRVSEISEKLSIYTGRLDRGLSSSEVLASVPGSCDGEVGLNEHGYIVPGAGGVGELLTNSWV